jgi:hypothetical protein
MAKKTDPPAFEPLKIETHRELAGNLKTIVERLNGNPDIARRALVNPLYALEEIGVQLSRDMQKHVHDTLHDPPAKQRRLAELETEIKTATEKLTGKAEIPAFPAARAQFLFETLQLRPLQEEDRAALDTPRLALYASQHPMAAKLVEYESVRKSGLVFHRRDIYDAYKKGEMKQHWVNSVTFGNKP